MMDVNISFENPNVDFQIDDLFTLEITAVPGAKGDPGDPATDEQVQTAVDNYLDEHPEIVVEDGSITTAKLADGAVTNDKIADGTITGNKFVPALPITEVKSTNSGANYEQSVTTKLGVTHTALLTTSDHYQNALGAVAFSTTATYAVGDYVVYDKKVYKCINEHTGAWSDDDFEEVQILPRLDDVEESVTEINSEITDLSNDIGEIVKSYTNLKRYLWKENCFLNVDHTTITQNNSYDIYRIPVKSTDFVQITWSGNIFGTLVNSAVYHLQKTDDSFMTTATGVGQSGYIHPSSNRYYNAFAFGWVGIKYIYISAYKDGVDTVSVNINEPYNVIDTHIPKTVQIFNGSTIAPDAMVSKFYINDLKKFSLFSGDFFAVYKKVYKDDVISFNGTITSLSFAGVFVTSETCVKITFSDTIYTIPSDGHVCLFFNTEQSWSAIYHPVGATKVLSSDVIWSSTPETDNPYDGLTGVAFGTSLTYRAQTTGGYLQYLPTLSGITFDNQGVGSSTILAHTGNPNMLTTITGYSSWTGKRVCLLEGFVNDWYYNGADLGTWKDTGTTTVCGCVRTAINHILTQNANLTVFLILDHFGKGITAENAVNDAGDTQLEFYQEIEKVALSMGVRVIREYELSEISSLTPQYLLDNIHMNDLGAKQSANAIWSGIKATYPNAI